MAQNQTPSRGSLLHTLQKLEISKHRAEKALAATGNRDAKLATDWLLAHLNDPMLDDTAMHREYILYACPTGAFLDQLQAFWAQTRAEHGWNGAHNFVPHITLVSFFQAADEFAPQLANALCDAVGKAAASASANGTTLLDGRRPLDLELRDSDSFVGFYVRDGATNDANMLQRLALQYVQNVKEVLGESISDTYEQLDALVTCFPWCGGVTNTQCIPRSSRSISLEPHDNKLHLTLAYKFPTADFAALRAAAQKTLDPSAATQWELRLYSRDPQLYVGCVEPFVYRVVKATTASTADDQLQLAVGDLVYMRFSADDARSSARTDRHPDSVDSVRVDAMCARTGIVGSVCLAHIERTAESDAWTLHETVAISATPVAAASPPSNMPDVALIRHLIRKSALSDLSQLDDSQTMSAIRRVAQAKEHTNAAVPQQLYVMRHGERVDFTFSPDWYRNGPFDAQTGVYRPLDLNMPRSLPARARSPASWSLDGPLTCIGRQQAWLTGRALREAGVRMRYVYCSPSFRCIETCAAMLVGLGQREECAIRVEPALFEWLVWYNEPGVTPTAEAPGFPDWMTTEELRAAGYNVDKDYVPFMSVADLRQRRGENCEEFYARNEAAAEQAVAENATGNILCVGHAVTLDSCTKRLTTGATRTFADMQRIMPRICYASLVLAERQPDSTAWCLTAPPAHGMTHNRNARFDWTVLTSEE